MRNAICFLTLVAGLYTACGATAQLSADTKKKEIRLDVDVGYNTAYRNESWVPVEVIVTNEQRDFSGWIEVRTYDSSQRVQSPVYRVPAECPQNSRKRFVVNAYFDNVDRVEAWLYEGGRVAVDAPAFMQTTSIDREDFLALVLDDEPTDFGFLYAAVQREGQAVRLHRYGLPTSDLARLPSIVQAYDAFDAVILGDISPDRVSIHHRELLRQYVDRGGTLIVCTGLRTADYRGSWVEPLLGVELGGTESMNGTALAEATLPQGARRDARADRQAVVARLTPVGDTVVTGGDRVLASRRDYGRGHVYTVAVDAAGHVLQDTPGYRLLWRSMLTRGESAPALNVDYFANSISQLLPNLSGVTIRSLSWVMTYLLLYVGIGVIGNWLFWNYLKRREMAWVCMVIFSFGFTGYAMVFGRAGWNASAELQQIDVVHVPRARDRAEAHTLAGILTARTRTYSGALPAGDILVRDAAVMSADMFRQAMRMAAPVTDALPFYWYEQEQPRVERMRVGASELRLLYLRRPLPVEGGVSGLVTVAEDGIEAALQNQTGIPLEQASLLYNGYFFPLRATGRDTYVLAMNSRALTRFYRENAFDPNTLMYAAYGGRIDDQSMRDVAQAALFVDENVQIAYGQPAYFVGWGSGTRGSAFEPDQELKQGLHKTLLVAEVDLRDLQRGDEFALSISLQRPANTWFRPMQVGLLDSRGRQRNNTPGSLLVQLPPGDLRPENGSLLITLLWSCGESGYRVQLAPPGAREAGEIEAMAEWHSTHAVQEEDQVGGHEDMRQTTYRIDDWTDYLDPNYDGDVLMFDVAAVPEDSGAGDAAASQGRRPDAIGEYSAAARYVYHETTKNTQGAWPQWR